MNLQYISDSEGNKTGVIIPIEEWKEIQETLSNQNDIPEWHKNILDKRENEKEHSDLNIAMDNIQRQL